MQELRSSIDGLTETNLDRQRIEERMDNMRDYQINFEKALNQQALEITEGKRALELQSAVIKAQAELEASRQIESGLQAE